MNEDRLLLGPTSKRLLDQYHADHPRLSSDPLVRAKTEKARKQCGNCDWWVPPDPRSAAAAAYAAARHAADAADAAERDRQKTGFCVGSESHPALGLL